MKTIRDLLVPAIKEHFPGKPFSFSDPPGPFVSLESPNEELGRMEIFDEGHEATLVFTNLTHGHFGCYDEKLPADDKARQITADVIKFLTALFADRVVICSMFGGRVDGWTILRPGQHVPKRWWFGRRHLWSGEIQKTSRS